MSKKRLGQWQADILKGFSEGWSSAVDPIGVLIQAVGMIRKVDWRTIGGVGFWKKDSAATWFGKLLPIGFMAWFAYTAWPTHWHWIVGFLVVATVANVLGIWWRATHPVVDDTTDKPGPDPATLEEGLSEPVEPSKPKEPPASPEASQKAVETALKSPEYLAELRLAANGKPFNENMVLHLEEAILTGQEDVQAFRKTVVAAAPEDSSESVQSS